MSIETYTGHYVGHIYISPIGNDWFCTGSTFTHPQEEAQRVVKQVELDSSFLRKIEYRVDTLGAAAQPTYHYYYPPIDGNEDNFANAAGSNVQTPISISDTGLKRLTDTAMRIILQTLREVMSKLQFLFLTLDLND
jgi:hypothetical protein